MKFSEIDLKPDLLKGLAEMGYESLTPVQEQTFDPVLSGRDILATAETGSGKTAACAIPLVQKIDPAQREIQALILVPTRELAQQYVAEISRIAQYTQVVPFAIFGGFDMGIQRAKLKHGVHVLVATPGRLIDLIYNSEISLAHVRTLVLDEADEMMKMGFIEDVDFVCSCLTHDHQVLLFSATMPSEVERLVRERLIDPVRIALNRGQVAPQRLVHSFLYVPHHGARYEKLCEYIRNTDIRQAIIFCNSRDGGERLHHQLRHDRLNSVEFIHGGLPQNKRTSLFDQFRRNDIRIMVATDLAGRGLDFSQVSHVINFDFPRTPEIYTHRTGRTARMGREGVAVSLVAERDLDNARRTIKAAHLEPQWIGHAPALEHGSHGGHRHAAEGEARRSSPGGSRRRPRRD